jgi:hypothetical protein
MTGPNRLTPTISKVELSDSPSRRAALVNGAPNLDSQTQMLVNGAPQWAFSDRIDPLPLASHGISLQAPRYRSVYFIDEGEALKSANTISGLWIADSESRRLQVIHAEMRPRFPVFSPGGRDLYFADEAAKVAGIWRARIGRDWRIESAEPLIPSEGSSPHDLTISADGSPRYGHPPTHPR